MAYQTETENGKTMIVGHIFNREDMKKMTGTNWTAADGSKIIVTIERIETRNCKDGEEWVDVHYIWPPTEHSRGFHNKDHFAFQCRYCLLIDDKTPDFVINRLE